ncbi:MAG: 5-formyltetrahydrofolate cyclo-ligase [Verrucomicrobiota bacterium]
MSDNKTALRTKMRQLADKRSGVTALSASLAKQLRAWPLWQSSGNVAAFSALVGEPDPLDPWPQDKQIALPRVFGEDLQFHWVGRRAELQPGRFGILEPAADAGEAGHDFELILVPGLAFDLRGGRLGRGRGYYDRFLSTARGLRVGVCFEDQIVDEVPLEHHDLRMDFVVTPDVISRCGS